MFIHLLKKICICETRSLQYLRMVWSDIRMLITCGDDYGLFGCQIIVFLMVIPGLHIGVRIGSPMMNLEMLFITRISLFRYREGLPLLLICEAFTQTKQQTKDMGLPNKKLRSILVARWGGDLLDRSILNVSLTPRDNHEAEVQFAIDRGISPILGIISTQHLPFSSNSFDMAHCSRCLIPSHGQNLVYFCYI